MVNPTARRRCNWLLLLLVLLPGCAQKRDPDEIRDAQTAYQEGLQAEQAGDFAAARESFRRAAERGGLQVDEFVDSQLRLAVCEVRLGDFAEAERVLETVAEGAPDLARVHAVRAYLLRKQQRTGEARLEEERARKINPRIELIGE